MRVCAGLEIYKQDLVRNGVCIASARHPSSLQQRLVYIFLNRFVRVCLLYFVFSRLIGAKDRVAEQINGWRVRY